MSLFLERHIGSSSSEQREMLDTLGLESLSELIDQTIPQAIRLPHDALDAVVGKGMDEQEFLRYFISLMGKNIVAKSYIGLGYSETVMPELLRRCILENPSWYTPYTPYQAELSQGRLEALLNFQTMVCDLTGMEVANASMLDEATAAAEAMAMAYNLSKKDEARHFFVCDTVFVHTIDVLKLHAEPLGIELVVGSRKELSGWDRSELQELFFGCIVQCPGEDGDLVVESRLFDLLAECEVFRIVAADILSMALITPPGEWGADAVVGSTQRFGIPMGCGGPHAAYLATKKAYIRKVPGRIVGVSRDMRGNRGLRLMLQTREQHIRREKATSNICTSQALLATLAGMYAVYHGPHGMERIARQVHKNSCYLDHNLRKHGFEQLNSAYFDTLTVRVPDAIALEEKARKAKINLRFGADDLVGISLGEGMNDQELFDILALFDIKSEHCSLPPKEFAPLKGVERTTPILQHSVFNSHHTETEMMRYIKSLEEKDVALDRSMIPLGSCTMKLNSAAALAPIAWPAVANIHPFAPVDQLQGYIEMFDKMETDLAAITGMDAASLQSNSGASGEYAALMAIRAYFADRGESQRHIALIPESAHGTNPASAAMAGMDIVPVRCTEEGAIDLDHLREKLLTHQGEIAVAMVTYPSTYGVFDEGIVDVCRLVHEHGGQVYLDGANLNAQMGLSSPGIVGADACHINLHKTFAIPHGGGGPGVGPVTVKSHLAPYLPRHHWQEVGGKRGILPVAAAPWGSASIIAISYGFIRMLGAEGLQSVSEHAILNANYIKEKLQPHYPVLYRGARGCVAHELIIDARPFKKRGVEVDDLAKRLMDYGFHAPTMSWPVLGTMMIEPTESESKEEIDRFCDTMIDIARTIAEIDPSQPLDSQSAYLIMKNAPHTAADLVDWQHPYSIAKGCFPLPFVKKRKFWPPVNRIDNTFGDRNPFIKFSDSLLSK
ncbi:aminomethyl-transferring glycine dehydrogenase [Simkania negevensis]|uniref:glycine dehydrogenase (aminomethyl-transferring) n=1 Tax=Simkania negevensis TaxID=83561 RepID=A0ABS3APL5_9BACT|nr:aminomethyl-transferring glycine dehydrogenase [Simkania negevensis]